MKIIKETAKNLITFCPAHKDEKTPNFHILKTDYKGHKKGWAYCFSCGYTAQYSPEWVDKMAKKKARIRKKQPINWNELALDYMNNLKNIPEWVTLWTIQRYSIGWDGDSWTIPMWNEKREAIGIQRRFPDGSKSCVEGSQLGLFLPGSFSYQDTKRMVICEGWSDAAVATECGFYGVGYPSASYGHSLVVDFLVRTAITNVTIVSDNNSVGEKSAQKISDLCEQKCIGSRMVYMPEGIQDLRNYYKVNGKEETIKLLKG